MRLVEWNCRQGLDRKGKQDVLRALAPQIAVIPEAASTNPFPEATGWLPWGDYASKGLAVVSFDGWRIEPLPAPANRPWVLPVRVIEPSGKDWGSLLAVWTVKRRGDGRPSYVEQVADMLDLWSSSLSEGRTVVAGDLNASFAGGSDELRSQNLERLVKLKLVSAYHHVSQEPHGKESQKTLRWKDRKKIARDYHCDFVVLPESMANAGARCFIDPLFERCGTEISDHQPVVVDFA